MFILNKIDFLIIFNLGVCSESTETLTNVDDALFEVAEVERFIKECAVQMKTTSGIKTFS